MGPGQNVLLAGAMGAGLSQSRGDDRRFCGKTGQSRTVCRGFARGAQVARPNQYPARKARCLRGYAARRRYAPTRSPGAVPTGPDTVREVGRSGVVASAGTAAHPGRPAARLVATTGASDLPALL